MTLLKLNTYLKLEKIRTHCRMKNSSYKNSCQEPESYWLKSKAAQHNNSFHEVMRYIWMKDISSSGLSVSRGRITECAVWPSTCSSHCCATANSRLRRRVAGEVTGHLWPHFMQVGELNTELGQFQARRCLHSFLTSFRISSAVLLKLICCDVTFRGLFVCTVVDCGKHFFTPSALELYCIICGLYRWNTKRPRRFSLRALYLVFKEACLFPMYEKYKILNVFLYNVLTVDIVS